MDVRSWLEGRRGRSVLAAMVLAVTWAGCGEPDVTGRWSGSWHLDSGLASGTLDLDLTQDGVDVDGDSTVGGTLCAFGGHFSGDLDGHHFRGDIESGLGRIDLDGNVNVGDDSIDGTFEAAAGACAGSRGRFRIDR